MDVSSTFIEKNKTKFLPIMILHGLMKARHADMSAGHWVGMKVVASEVNIMAIAFVWS